MMISIQWIETRITPSSHPAFDSCTKTPTGVTKSFLGEVVPEFKCTLTPKIKMSKTTQRQWAEDKIRHLKTWGIKGEIVN